MLSADQLDVLPGPILDLYERFHISVLRDMARRLARLDYMSAAWQAQRLIEAGLLYEEVIQRLSELTGQSEMVLKQIFEQAGVKAMRFDDAIYRAAGLEPLPLNLSPQMVEVLNIGLQKTQGLLRNLVMTTAISAQEVFLDATDLAYMQISTGTLDYNTAIREAVKEAARKGLQVIYFESGHRDKIDVATRRAVLTGVNQTAGELTEARADELETDLVQTSAHIGARDKGDPPENHEAWQGQVFTRGKDPNNTQYPNFYDVTGYMTVTGLYGVNCRHSHYPYFKGISENAYKQAVLDDYASKTATYNGKEMSWYDATQVQRKIERDIRKAKREQAMVEAAGLDASEEKQRVRNLQAQMRDFVEQTGLQRQYPREQAVFTPTLMNISEAGKKIDFTSGDYQHVADLGNIQSFYQANDPGKPYVTQSPVIYNQYAVRHLADETHSKRLDWLKENQEGLMQAIVNPDFIEKVIRKRVDGHYSITLISELFLGNKSEQRFLVAAVSLGLKPGKSYHQITTIHPARWKDLFYQNGELKKKYLRIK